MISYRHHVVSLVAVFLALAVGIALGSTVLADADDDTTPDARPAAATGAPGAGYGDDFALQVAPRLYADGLAGHPVAVLTLPGADERDVEALTEQVAAAGGGIAGRYDLRPGLVAAGEKTLVDTLGRELSAATPGVAADAPTYVRLGQLLGAAAASTDPAGTPLGDTDAPVRESMVAADLLTLATEPVRRAPLVLLVLGDEVEPAVLAGISAGLAESATGVVVAGSTAAGHSGDLASLRADPAAAGLSTVDGVETGLGRVTAVLALVRELSETGGSFGAASSEGAVPLG
ncbi:copper transporter [Nocardioides pantholopis]|uniref:copper transporter n=1 Tax=Nocardioides pantholopis TaxID=2483798 RepID=UPI000F0741EF|nr:copper transporter [Nocardioides pantholopis]